MCIWVRFHTLPSHWKASTKIILPWLIQLSNDSWYLVGQVPHPYSPYKWSVDILGPLFTHINFISAGFFFFFKPPRIKIAVLLSTEIRDSQSVNYNFWESLRPLLGGCGRVCKVKTSIIITLRCYLPPHILSWARRTCAHENSFPEVLW